MSSTEPESQVLSPDGSREKATKKPGHPPKAAEGVIRERLLSCATQLFTQKGYTATTVREMVQAAGVTKPVLYYYFKNKEAIYLELFRKPFAKFDALLDSIKEQPGTAKERLLYVSDQVFSLFKEHFESARLMYSIYYGPPQGAPFFDFDFYHVKLHEAVRHLIKEAIRRGEFRTGNVDDMMWAVVGTLNVVLEVQLCHPEMKMDRNGLARILRLVFRGIEANHARRKRGHA
jgi:AcrR family transcriptional regulator